MIALVPVLTAGAQVNKRDTVKLDTANVEKIRKVPMDTVPSTMPVKKLPQSPAPGNNKDPKKKEPVGAMKD